MCAAIEIAEHFDKFTIVRLQESQFLHASNGQQQNADDEVLPEEVLDGYTIVLSGNAWAAILFPHWLTQGLKWRSDQDAEF